MFADPDGPDDDPSTFEDNDYRVRAGSPAIDAGNSPVALDEALAFFGDFNGDPRFVDDPDPPHDRRRVCQSRLGGRRKVDACASQVGAGCRLLRRSATLLRPIKRCVSLTCLTCRLTCPYLPPSPVE